MLNYLCLSNSNDKRKQSIHSHPVVIELTGVNISSIIVYVLYYDYVDKWIVRLSTFYNVYRCIRRLTVLQHVPDTANR